MVYRLKETRMFRFLEKNLVKIFLHLIIQHHHHPVIIMCVLIVVSDTVHHLTWRVIVKLIEASLTKKLANVLTVTKYMYQCQLIVCIFGLINKAVDVHIVENVSVVHGFYRVTSEHTPVSNENID